MAQEPDSLAFRFAVVLALAVIVLLVTTWAASPHYDRGGIKNSLDRLPQQQSTDEHQPDRVEDIGRTQQVP